MSDRLQDRGMLELCTPRFTLRRLRVEDIPAMFEMDGDSRVTRYVKNLSDDFESYAARVGKAIEAREGKPLGLWTITRAEQPGFQGWAALKELPGTGHIEVGYRLPFWNWGQGIATEVAARMLRYGFMDLGLPQIVAVTQPGNIASQRVITKIGLVLRGTEFHYDTEVLFYALGAKDYSMGKP